jgi:hypothetical protein
VNVAPIRVGAILLPQIRKGSIGDWDDRDMVAQTIFVSSVKNICLCHIASPNPTKESCEELERLYQMANKTNNRFARIESFLFLLCMSTCNLVSRCMGSLEPYSLHCHAPNIFHDIKVRGDILNYFSKTYMFHKEVQTR